MENRGSYTPEQVADIVILHGAFAFNLKRAKESEGIVKDTRLEDARTYQKFIPQNVSTLLSLEKMLEGIK